MALLHKVENISRLWHVLRTLNLKLLPPHQMKSNSDLSKCCLKIKNEDMLSSNGTAVPEIPTLL